LFSLLNTIVKYQTTHLIDYLNKDAVLKWNYEALKLTCMRIGLLYDQLNSPNFVSIYEYCWGNSIKKSIMAFKKLEDANIEALMPIRYISEPSMKMSGLIMYSIIMKAIMFNDNIEKLGKLIELIKSVDRHNEWIKLCHLLIEMLVNINNGGYIDYSNVVKSALLNHLYLKVKI